MPEGGAGDYLVWYQATCFAKEQARDLLIVTRDQKEDWWWRQQSDFIGPRPELTLEYRELTGRRLFLMRLADLLARASVLKVEVDQASFVDAGRVADGRVSREKVYELGDYSDHRMLRGFTRPFRRLTEALQDEGAIPAGVSPIFVARYPDGVKASYFSVPSEVPPLLEELSVQGDRPGPAPSAG